MKVNNKSKLTKGDIQYLCFKYRQSLFNVTSSNDVLLYNAAKF